MKEDVSNYRYYFSEWLNYEKGNLELSSYWYEASSFSRVDSELTDGTYYNMYPESNLTDLISNVPINGVSYTFS